MSKQLSNGTLSLRFMQNAQRAKQQAQVEAEQAKVKDDAEWEVPQAMREQWGIEASSNSTPSRTVRTVTCEASYVPFMFSLDADASPQAKHIQSKGRRKFNTNGEEVAPEEANTNTDSHSDSQPGPGDGSPSGQHRTTISGFQAPLSIKSSSRDTGSKRTKSVQMLIREDSGKGLRDPPPLQVAMSVPAVAPTAPSTSTSSVTLGFMKPTGVDSPVPVNRKSKFAGPVGSSSTSTKREREIDNPTSVPGGKEGKKRKKVKEETTL